MEKMKAVVQDRYGSIDNLRVEEVDKPTPGAGEVLVRVKAASVHPDVWHVVVARPRVLRLMGAGFLRPKNRIPGTDMAGVVERLGEGATVFKEGDGVFGETIANMQWVHGGAYAEYVSVKEECLAAKPGNVTFAQAASVPTTGFIVYLNLDQGRFVKPGTSVLVNGAGGGAGTVALQMIKAMGGTVTAVDCAAKREMLQGLGADRVLDYAQQPYTQLGEQFDVLFDIPGNHTLAERLGVIKPEGRYIPIGHDDFGKKGKATLGQIPGMLGLAIRARFNSKLPRMSLAMPTKPETMAALQAYLAEGKLTPVISQVFPLEQVQDAMRMMMNDNPVGKVMIAP